MNQAINDRIIELLHKRLRQEALTGEEQKELQQWIDLSPENELLFRELTDKQSLSEALEKFSNIDTEASLQQVRQRIFVDKEAEELPTIRTNQMPWRRYAAAAIILILLMAGGVYYFQQPVKTKTAEKKSDPTNFFTELIPPGGDKTRLTLSNGSKDFDLDVSQNGKLVIEESAFIHGEKLLYRIPNDANNTVGEVMLNTLATPRGLKQQVVLPDRSVVWLNSVSAIRFPTKFSGTERRIELTGEAEFEIAKDASKPFIVQMITEKGEPKGAAVRVLGTHFNITAYDNEPAITATLMEGSVMVSNNKKTDTLKPGQQAIVTDYSITKKDTETKSYEARKTGFYDFRDVPFKTVTNQLERMFNVQVLYGNTGSLPKNYTIPLDQSDNLEDIVKAFNLSDDIKCELSKDQKTVTFTGVSKPRP